MMTMMRALVVLGVVTLVVSMVYVLTSGATKRRISVADARTRWVATHYAVEDATRVVVRKVRLGTDDVLDEHVVAQIPNGNSDFDTRFLEAMAEARARAALFESESD